MYNFSFRKLNKTDVLFFDDFEINLNKKVKTLYFHKLKKKIFLRYLILAIIFFLKIFIIF